MWGNVRFALSVTNRRGRGRIPRAENIRALGSSATGWRTERGVAMSLASLNFPDVDPGQVPVH